MTILPATSSAAEFVDGELAVHAGRNTNKLRSELLGLHTTEAHFITCAEAW